MIRRAIAATLIALAAIVPAPAEGTALPGPLVLRADSFREATADIRLPDERFVDWPTEVVIPVTPAPKAPRPSRTAQDARPWPTAVSGAALAWPRLHLGETGVVSTYGPGYAGYLALPWPWGASSWRVRICGAGGCVTKVSNDSGPERELHRIADLDVATFEAVCGVPWRFGLCVATVTVLGRAE